MHAQNQTSRPCAFKVRDGISVSDPIVASQSQLRQNGRDPVVIARPGQYTPQPLYVGKTDAETTFLKGL
jgi:hypothetical protein